MSQLVVFVVIFILALLILRLFGAWMLRIDELIKEQKRTNELLIQGFNKVNQNIKKVGGIEENDTDTKA